MRNENLWTFEGDLYSKKLGYKTPLRKNYEKTFGRIETTTEFKATLRAGAFAWPGGYPMFLITSDSAALCFPCAKKNARNILDSIKSKSRDGWKVVATEINYEDSSLYCDHCSKKIESAYAENDDDEN